MHTTDHRPSSGSALRTALTYAALSAIWILTSDQLLGWLFTSATALSVASTLKGWLFIAITAGALYLHLRQREAGTRPDRASTPLRLSPAMMLLLSGIVLVTGFAAGERIRHERERVTGTLRAVADSRSRQVADWLRPRLAAADFLTGNPVIARQIAETGSGDTARSALLASLVQLQRSHGIDSISVHAANGALRWQTPGPPSPPPDRTLLQTALASGRAVRSEPRTATRAEDRMDIYCPVTTPSGARHVLILHVDTRKGLDSLMQPGTATSQTGEVLLFRRDGQSIIYLNAPRDQPDTGRTLVRPLTDRDLLSSQLLRGAIRDGQLATGRDYRKQPVTGVVRVVPGTDWHLLAKIDTAELDRRMLDAGAWVVLSGILSGFVTVAAMLVLRQRMALASAEREHRQQQAQLRALQLMNAIADSSDDAIFVKDLNDRYLLFNRAAGRIIGRDPASVLGQDDLALFPEHEARILQQTSRDILSHGRVVTIEEHLSTPDGLRVFLTTKGPLHDPDGKPIGIFGISRDITERHAATADLTRQAQALQRQNAELERFNQAMTGRELEMIKLKHIINDLHRRLGEAPPYDPPGEHGS